MSNGKWEVTRDHVVNAEAVKAISPSGEYKEWYAAFKSLNNYFFKGSLPEPMITIHRQRGARGYFNPEKFSRRDGLNGRAHEIGMNPDFMEGRSDADILSTFLHEMVHEWTYVTNQYPRKCYHDKVFAEKMKECGLQVVNINDWQKCQRGETVAIRETGAKCSHEIIPGGKFEQYLRSDKVMQKGWALKWQGVPDAPKAKKVSTNTREKYTCPVCNGNAWAKPDSQLVCGDCSNFNEGIIFRMKAESEVQPQGKPDQQVNEYRKAACN